MSDHDDQRSTSRRSILGGTIGAGALGVLGTAAAGLSLGRTRIRPRHDHDVLDHQWRPHGLRGDRQPGELGLPALLPHPAEHLAGLLERQHPVRVRQRVAVWGYGAHYDGRPTEAHNNGRGFDLSRIYTGSTRRFIARHDIWKNWSGSDLTRARRHYWATSASAHYHFRNVLTYLYNADHDNHIHIDNLVSGTSNSSFDSSSRAQVLHVQASCRYVWGLPTTVDGIWGSQTSSHSTRVLRAAGVATAASAPSRAGSPSTARRCARATAPRPTGRPDSESRPHDDAPTTELVAGASSLSDDRTVRGRRGRGAARRGWCPAGRPGSPRTPARAPRGCS